MHLARPWLSAGTRQIVLTYQTEVLKMSMAQGGVSPVGVQQREQVWDREWALGSSGKPHLVVDELPKTLWVRGFRFGVKRLPRWPASTLALISPTPSPHFRRHQKRKDVYGMTSLCAFLWAALFLFIRKWTGQNNSLTLRFCGLKPLNRQRGVRVSEGHSGRQGREPQVLLQGTWTPTAYSHHHGPVWASAVAC